MSGWVGLIIDTPTFNRSSPDPYLVLFLTYIVYFLYYRHDYVVDQCVSWMSNSEHSNRRGYDINVVCTFSVDKTISINDLKWQIHVGFKLLPSHFNTTISARINTAPPGSSIFFMVYLGWFLRKFRE
jgi:hypothetical protein